ncbi:CLC_0170 family protein [Cohnella lubricantis]|uniref:Uncharacterized protein n=1 Tax=Cohnella lubricantis TaxID=2163172 RepID=A0A841TCW6_9BACL|nr:CLC_0170 family protein [Cohnella lubricantis]MBB6677855.1 hypothetical protein [Cohnella lubricantis]MBP2119034.1 hypothetical protein [Cohnella lubricantis]
MGTGTFASSYEGYAILISLISGLLLLRIDAPSYQDDGHKTEKKAAQALGWFNVVLGGTAFLAKVIFSSF